MVKCLTRAVNSDWMIQDSEYFNSLQWILENEPDCLELTFSVDEDVFGEVSRMERFELTWCGCTSFSFMQRVLVFQY